MLLVPEQATELHLQLLSEIAAMFFERAFRERLASAATPEELEALFHAWEPAA